MILDLKFKVFATIIIIVVVGFLFWRNVLYTPKLLEFYPKEQLIESAPPIYDTLGKRSEKDFEFAVASSTKRLSVSISFAGAKKGVSLTRPTGAVVSEKDVDAKIQNMEKVGYFEVTNPEFGTWHLKISGSGDFSLKILTDEKSKPESQQNNSPFIQQLVDAIYVDKEPGIQFEFVALAGRPGHQGLFPIAGQPTSHKQIAQVRAFDPPLEKVELKLFSVSGKILLQTILPRGDGIYSPTEDFVSEIELPAEPFRVFISGTDKNGVVHEKMLQQAYRVTGVGIYSNLSFDELKRGAENTLSFLVENNGSEATFRVVIVEVPVGGTKAWIPDFEEPTPIKLAGGESRVVEKSFFVPADDPGITKYSITATAVDIGDENNKNGISFDLYVDY